MKKLLICLLLLANLSSGLAFALDNHPEAIAGHNSAAIDLLIEVSSEQPDNGVVHQDDHCCHSAAHLIGLIFNQSSPFMASGHEGFVALSPVLALRYIAPLLRPPII